jgi:release factor family 10
MQDAERERLQRLAAWRPPHGVISIIFDIDRGDRGGGWRVELRDGLDQLEEPQGHEGKLALRETVKRVLERFDPQDEPPPGRAQIGFVEVARKGGTENWSELQISADQTVVRHAPRPLLRPLIGLFNRARPHLVLAISGERIRAWVWDGGRLERAPEWDTELSIYPGHERKAPAMADPARGHATSSSGRDQFGQRLEENRKRFVHDLAKRLAESGRIRGTEVIALGEAPHLEEFSAALPSTVQLRAIEGADVIGEPDGAIAERVGPEIERALAERESALTRSVIDAAMAREGRGAVGVHETSAALAEGRVEHLLLDSVRHISTQELSPLAVEAVAEGGDLDAAELLVELALRTSADVTAVRTEAAESLLEHGGVAALLRY